MSNNSQSNPKLLSSILNAAQRNEMMLEILLKTTLDGIWIVDKQGVIREVNDVYLSYVGYTRDEFLSSKIADVEAVESNTDIGEHIAKIMKYGSDRFETIHRRKDGSLFNVEISVSYVNLDDNDEFICFLRDITDAKRAELLVRSRLGISELSHQNKMDDVIQLALDDAETISNSTIGFFHFVDADQETLTLQTWSTNTQKHMCKAEGKGSHYPASHAGIWAECLYTRKPVIHNDYATALNKKGLPPGHAPILRELTIPIIRNDTVMAIIGVGNKASYYTDTDIESVSLLANMVIDVVTRKRAEEALLRANEELESRVAQRTKELHILSQFNELVVEASPIGKYVYNIETGQCVLVNQAAVDLINAPNKEALLAQNFYQTESWKKSGLFDSIMITINNKADTTIEMQHKSTFGKEAWFSTRCSYFLWNNVPHLLLSVSDISTKKQSEIILQENERKFRLLFENITEGVALHEVIYNQQNEAIDYRILDINPAYTQQIGLTRTVVGKTSGEAYGTSEVPYLKEYAAVAETGNPFQFETYFPPMKKHFIISVISPQKGRFATVFEDITDSKRNEEELRQKNEELTRFIYTVSHDLKSPLVTIKSFTAYLQEDILTNDTEAQAKDIRYIQNAADKMGKLLDELLELSRVGRKEIQKTEISLQQIAQSTVDLVAGRIVSRGVKVEITATPVTLECDVPRIMQLYQNLVDNAVKFMGSQTNPVIEIGVIAPNSKKNETILFVRDNGIGIDARYHHKLFGLFEKLDPASEGTGIGLALVKRIIEVHGGRIWVESAGINQGTCFFFTIENTKIKQAKD